MLFDAAGGDAKRSPVSNWIRPFKARKRWRCVQQAVQNEPPYAMAFVDMRMPPGWDGVETDGANVGGLPGFADRDLHGVFGLFVGRDGRPN